MTTDELAQVLLPNGYVFETGTPFYEQIGEKRARELQTILKDTRSNRFAICDVQTCKIEKVRCKRTCGGGSDFLQSRILPPPWFGHTMKSGGAEFPLAVLN